jgi:hypothetical protein
MALNMISWRGVGGKLNVSYIFFIREIDVGTIVMVNSSSNSDTQKAGHSIPFKRFFFDLA